MLKYIAIISCYILEGHFSNIVNQFYQSIPLFISQ